MRAVIQRVQQARVIVAEQQIAQIEQGYLIFLGVGHEDTPAQADKLWRKIVNLRIFQDHEGKTNRNLDAVGGSVLIVSQFTLFANCKKGNRPSFIESAAPEQGEALYRYFTELARVDIADVQTGEFGAFMQVSLINDGPFTIVLDTDQL